MTHVRLIGIVLVLGSCAGPRGSSNSPRDANLNILSVCQIFANLSSYQDKMVTVRGIFFFGLRQQNCPQEFVTGKHRWPSVLDWVHSNYPGDKYERPVDFVTDEKSWNKLELLAVSEGRKGHREELWVTAEGQIRGPHRYVRPGVKGGVGGYGHMGGLAAELVVKRIIDIEIMQTPTYDYREVLRPRL